MTSKVCETCGYKDLNHDDYPCNDCQGGSRWEPSELPAKAPDHGDWELITEYQGHKTMRLPVPGGWLYRTLDYYENDVSNGVEWYTAIDESVTTCFVQDLSVEDVEVKIPTAARNETRHCGNCRHHFPSAACDKCSDKLLEWEPRS